MRWCASDSLEKSDVPVFHTLTNPHNTHSWYASTSGNFWQEVDITPVSVVLLNDKNPEGEKE